MKCGEILFEGGGYKILWYSSCMADGPMKTI